tara:strand:+ start:591 stop:968 length:378 start_codon:yes stop_codon:yes gene_type:complete
MSTLNKVMLYFAENESADAEADAIIVPAENVIGIHPTAATTCNIYFKNTRLVEGTDADSAFNFVQLTYTSGKFKEVAEAVVSAINGGPHNNGFVVIADQDNGVYASSHINNVEISYNDSNVNPTD